MRKFSQRQLFQSTSIWYKMVYYINACMDAFFQSHWSTKSGKLTGIHQGTACRVSNCCPPMPPPPKHKAKYERVISHHHPLRSKALLRPYFLGAGWHCGGTLLDFHASKHFISLRFLGKCHRTIPRFFKRIIPFSKWLIPMVSKSPK